jgi:hypothetical protein
MLEFLTILRSCAHARFPLSSILSFPVGASDVLRPARGRRFFYGLCREQAGRLPVPRPGERHPGKLYIGLDTVACGETGSGTEVTGGSYARVAVTSSLANWAGTQSAGSTTASSGTGGTTSNNNAITFSAPHG